MRFRLFLFLAPVLLIGGLLATGCTPGSSQSSTVPDTSTSPPDTSRTVRTATSTPEDATTAPGSERTVDQRLRDASVRARVKQALVRDNTLRVFDFFPEVVNGDVTLRGDVDTHEQYRRAERVARRVDGVGTLTNQVTVEGRAVEAKTEASTSESSTGSDQVYHTIQPGDTLWEIARENGVSIEQIQALNSGSLSSLQPGERIRVR